MSIFLIYNIRIIVTRNQLNGLVFLQIPRDFHMEIKYYEDEPDRIGEVFVQSVGKQVLYLTIIRRR